MRWIGGALLVAIAAGCGTGCATRTPRAAGDAADGSPTAATTTPTTRPTDIALLTLDQIEPKPVLARPATRPFTRPATRPAEPPPLGAIHLYARARAAQLNGDRATSIQLLEKALAADPDSYALNFALGQAYLASSGGNERAMAVLAQAARLAPDSLDVHLLLGRQYFTRNDLPQAVEHLRLALQTIEYRDRSESAALVNLFLARALQQQGYDTAALEQYEQLLRRLNNRVGLRTTPELYYLINRPEMVLIQVGDLHQRRGRHEDALRYYRRAAEGDSNNFDYHARVVRTLLKLKEYKEARELAADLVAGHRASNVSIDLLKETYGQGTGGKEDVVEALRALLRKRGGDRSIAFALADTLSASGREAEAERLLIDLLRESGRAPTVVLRLFEFYTTRGRTLDAARLLIETIARSPDSLDEIEPLWARLLRTGTKNRLRLAHLQSLQVAEGATAARLYMTARLAESWNRDALVRPNLERAAAEDPPFAPAYRGLLRLDLGREDQDEAAKREAARRLIGRAADAGGGERLAAELRGLLALHEKKIGEAVAAFNEAVRLGSKSPGLHFALATALYADGKDAEGEGLLWRITREWPTYDEAYLTLFRRYLQAGNGKQAMKVMETWLAADPYSVNARLLQANLFVEARRFEAAEGALAALFRDEPDDPQVLAEMSRFYTRMNRVEALIAKLEEERARHPDNRAVVDALVRAYTAQQRTDDATRVINDMRTEVAGDAEELYFVAHFYERVDRRETTEQVLREVLRIDPRNAAANNDLGYMMAEDGRNLTEAEAMIRHAVSAEPDNFAYLDSLGWVLYKQGKFEEARRHLGEAARSAIDPDPVVLDHLGDVLYRLEERDEAVRTWQRSLERLGGADGPVAQRDDLRKLQLQLKQKLRQHEEGQPVNVSPVAAESKGETARQAKN